MLQIMLGALKQLTGSFVPLIAPPFIEATGVAGGVELTWGDSPGASTFLIFESLIGAYNTGTQIAVVPDSNTPDVNKFARLGLNDTQKRFYYVVPVNRLGIQGDPSQIASAAATSASNVVLLDETINGKFAKPLQTTITNGGQVDLSSDDVINGGGMQFRQQSIFGGRSVTAGVLPIPDALISVDLGQNFAVTSLAYNANWKVNRGIFTAGSGNLASVATNTVDFRAQAIFQNSGVGNHQFAQLTLVDVDAVSSNYIGPGVNMDSVAETYFGTGVHSNTSTVVLFKVVSGAVTVIATQPYTPNPGDVLRIESNPSTGDLFVLVNGVNQITANDMTITGGAPGIHAVQSDATSQIISNWSGGDLDTGVQVSDPFAAQDGPKPCLLLAQLVFQTDAVANNVTLQVLRDGVALLTAPFNYNLPISSTVTIPFVYLDNGMQTSGPGGAFPPFLTPGVHQYQLQMGTTAGTLTLLDGYMVGVTPVG